MCPRCSRIVTSAHGICGACGEHVLQCRRCRSLNYENVGAFLCCDCGYCSSGSFSWSLRGHEATDAIPCTSQTAYERLVKVRSTCTSKLSVKQKALSGLRETLMADGRVLRAHLGYGGGYGDGASSSVSVSDSSELALIIEGGSGASSKKKKVGKTLSPQQQRLIDTASTLATVGSIGAR